MLIVTSVHSFYVILTKLTWINSIHFCCQCYYYIIILFFFRDNALCYVNIWLLFLFGVSKQLQSCLEGQSPHEKMFHTTRWCSLINYTTVIVVCSAFFWNVVQLFLIKRVILAKSKFYWKTTVDWGWGEDFTSGIHSN